MEDAERMAIKTYLSNTYLFDTFFNRHIIKIDKWEWSNWGSPELAEYFKYNCNDEYLLDFSDWLKQFEQSKRFKRKVDRFLEIQKALKVEDSTEKRRQLVREADQLIEGF